MIAVGLGKDRKELAYLGVMKCPNCRNHSHFSLVETANRRKLIRMPVTRYYSLCSICNAGFEVDDKKKDRIVAESAKLPDQKTFLIIKESLDEAVRSSRKEGSLAEGTLLEAAERLKRTYAAGYVEYVVQCYLNWLFDQDVPHF